MKVLIVEPGKYPREADIEHTLEAEQAVVGGTIEAVYLGGIAPASSVMSSSYK